MKGISFNTLREAREYQSQKRQEGYLTEITRISSGYKVTITGEVPEWKNGKKVENLGDAIKDEDELS